MPAGAAKLAPVVVIGGLSAHVDHAVDRRAAAQQAAAAGQQQKTASDLPSAVATGILVQEQATGYSGRELRKLACDIGKPGVRSAFSFVYGMMTGRIGVL